MMYRLLGKTYVFMLIFITGWITGVVNSAQAIRGGKVKGIKVERSPGSSLLAHWNGVTHVGQDGHVRRRRDEHTH